MERDVACRQQFSKVLDRSFIGYAGDFPERSRQYAEAYPRFIDVASKKGTGKGAFSLSGVLTAQERRVWSGLIVSPDKFAVLSLMQKVTGVVEAIQAEQQSREISARSRAESYLPKELLAGPKGAVVQKTESKMERLAAKRGCADLGKKLPAAPLEVEAESSTLKLSEEIAGSITPPKALEVLEKEAPHLEVAKQSDDSSRDSSSLKDTSPLKISDIPTPTGSASGSVIDPVQHGSCVRFPRVGDAHTLAYRYDIHVARWWLLGDARYNPFLSDPSYAQSSSDGMQAGILLHHAFALALHDVLIQCGCPFEKRDGGGKLLRTTFALIGEIEFPDGRVQKGVFTLGMDPGKTIFHAHFTRKPVSEIIETMERENCCRTDAEPEVLLGESFESQRRSAVYQLGDDGSRVIFASEESVEVRDAKGLIFRVLPFPEL
jgi:hypothetical protein